ncbi:CAP domain-containing protein [Erythrobacter sp. MTPC3]|uniref:CAP domain-containing protein n=1 Tax=Erythrobacter sp. MTPC3 TaxID=3056564 RepID=UPI0036F36CC0
MKFRDKLPRMSGAMIIAIAGAPAVTGGAWANTPTSSISANTVAAATAPMTHRRTGTGTPRQQEMLGVLLREHNAARADVGAPPLRLDAALSAQALAYAQKLAATGRFRHSAKSDRPGQGENLWAGTQGAYSYEEMASGWIEEKQDYRHAAFPNVSKTGNWQDVGHYTQVIWRDTAKLGCGVASGNGRDVLVCRYSSAGNIMGRYVY